MSFDYNPDGSAAGLPNEREEAILMESLQEFTELRNRRSTFEIHWEEAAELMMPHMRNTFVYGSYNWPGEKKTERQVDATAMMANSRFAAILDSLLTPRNMLWHGLAADDDYVNKQRGVKLYFEEVTRLLFKQRYSPIANFASQNQQVYQSLGALGTGPMFIDQAVDASGQKLRALRYKALPLGEVYLRENHQGLVDGFIRAFRLTAGQAIKQFGKDKVPEAIHTLADKSSQTPIDFIHRVCPNSDYDPRRLASRYKPFASYYICVTHRCLLSEGGYNSLPIMASRYDQAPGEIYGRGPGMLVLPAVKTLNAEKRVFLKQGHRASDPVLLSADDGLVGAINLRPGAMNPGGMSSDGKRLVDILPTGNIQINKEMMDEERSLINDAFLVTLFQILTEQPQMTATEVVERTNEKGILLAPTVGRQQSEYLGPMIDRELDLLAELGMLPPMPGALREAAGEYHVVYTSPLARQQRAQEVAGFQRTLETTLAVVNATQDPSPLDNFNFDTALPEIAEINGMPASWSATPDEIAAKRQNRAQQQQQQTEIQAAPAAAAMVKAQAAVSKATG